MADLDGHRFRLLVFDWDGTLADSTTMIAQCIQAACSDIGEPIPDDQAARYVIGLGLADALQRIAPRLPASRHLELAERYRDHYLSRESDIPLFTGVPELLHELRECGFSLAVATGKTRMGLNRVLARNGLDSRFDATRCADEGRPKPHPDMLLHLMDRLAIDPGQTLMIGDTTHDLQLAHRAGARAVAVAYGAHPSDLLATEPALGIVRTVEELRIWLMQHAV